MLLAGRISGLTPTVTFDQTFSTGSDRTQLKAKISSTNDFKTDFSYDTLGRMTDIVQQGNSGNAVASKHVTLAYNKLGQFTSFNRYESTGTSSQVASTDFTYDTLNRLTDIDHKQGSTVLASYDYAYDFISRITSVNSSQDGVTDYSYDADNQVTGADHTGQTDETYAFNANGSRTGSGYSVSTNNLTTSDGTYNYTYDDEGNRTQKTAISGGAYTTYSWDYRNRLIAVKDYSNVGALLKETTYSYDTHNRLIRSTYDADGAGAGAATSRYWAFDEGINPLLEFNGSSASDVSHRYLWGPAVDQLLADEQPTSTGSAGNVLWGLSDNLGTIRDIADLSGSTTSITNHRRFGAYGNLVSESNSAVDMLFAYTGKLYDENTQLQNNLFRWYDAATGQWMSEDPLGFAAGDENVRRYAGNNGAGLFDSNGLVGDSFLPYFIWSWFISPPPDRMVYPSPTTLRSDVMGTIVNSPSDSIDGNIVLIQSDFDGDCIWPIDPVGSTENDIIKLTNKMRYSKHTDVGSLLEFIEILKTYKNGGINTLILGGEQGAGGVSTRSSQKDDNIDAMSMLYNKTPMPDGTGKTVGATASDLLRQKMAPNGVIILLSCNQSDQNMIFATQDLADIAGSDVIGNMGNIFIPPIFTANHGRTMHGTGDWVRLTPKPLQVDN